MSCTGRAQLMLFKSDDGKFHPFIIFQISGIIIVICPGIIRPQAKQAVSTCAFFIQVMTKPVMIIQTHHFTEVGVGHFGVSFNDDEILVIFCGCRLAEVMRPDNDRRTTGGKIGNDRFEVDIDVTLLLCRTLFQKAFQSFLQKSRNYKGTVPVNAGTAFHIHLPVACRK